MKAVLKFLIPIVLTTLACSLGVQSDSTGQQPALTTDRPALVLLAPQAQSQYALGVPILLHAEARDLTGGIVRVEFYDNFDAVIGTVNATNPQGDANLTAIVSWQPPTAQTHFVRAKAFRADGTESPVAEASVVVSPLPEGFSLPVTSSETVNPAPPVEAAPTAEGSSANPTTQTVVQAEAPPAVEAPVAGQGGGEALTNPPAVTTLQATVLIELANVRVSPNLNAGMAMLPLAEGTRLELAWRTEDSQWVATPLAAGGYGWVFAVGSLNVDGDINSLPVATTE